MGVSDRPLRGDGNAPRYWHHPDGIHLGDWRKPQREGPGPPTGTALCGEPDVRVTSHHEIKRGRITCTDCLRVHGEREHARRERRRAAS